MGSFIFESFYTANNLEALTSKEALLAATISLTYFIAPVALLEMLTSLFILRRVKLLILKMKH